MRVLLVTDSYPPAPGGVAGHVKRLAENLTRRGSDVLVVAAGTEDSDDLVAGVRCRRVRLALADMPAAFQDPRLPFVPPWADRNLVSAIRSSVSQWSPDVLHAHGWSEVAASKVADEVGIPLVVTLHDYGLLCPQKSLFRDGRSCDHFASLRCSRCPGSNQGDLKRLALAGALGRYARKNPPYLYIAVSNHVRDLHVAGPSKREVIVIPNFIDVTTQAPPLYFPERPTALFVGPDTAYKGAPIFRAVHDTLVDGGWQGESVHVGGTRQYTSGSFRSLGRLDGPELAAEYRRCSVLVAPSLYADPCPTVIIEAMDSGLPVVASTTGGHGDLVDEDSGVLVDVGDVCATAKAVRDLSEDLPQLERRGEAARRRAMEFSSERVVPRIETAYRSVLDHRRQTGYGGVLPAGGISARRRDTSGRGVAGDR